MNGVLWRLRTGAPWRDLPERYGPWQTVYRRFAHSIVLSTENTADCSMFPAVLDAIRIPRVVAGRPRTKPDRVVADKAYSSRKIRHLLRRRSIKATIPERRDQIANRARRASEGGRPPTFDKVAYRGRNVMERCFARLKQFRAVATRFDKPAVRYRAGVVIAALILWLRADG